MPRRVGTAKALQIGFIGLLVTCFAQVSFWIMDQVRYTAAVRDELIGSYEREAEMAQTLLDEGATESELVAQWPHLAVVDGRAVVSPSEIERIHKARNRRLNQYGWEGSFFLVVLVGGIGVIAAALRQRQALHRREENFVAAVSHEFKSPLASLRLSAETLARRKPDEATAERLSGRMVGDVERLESMVTNILDAARLDDSSRHYDTGAVELARSAARIIARVSCQASLRGVHLDSKVPEEALVRADRTALEAVIENLLRNASKSVAANGGGTVHLSAARDGAHWRIEVADDGLGFESAEAARLFDKFYRPGDEMRRRTAGTGLGLYIVKKFVEEHGGRVRAASDGPGRGATFRVWWPATEEQAA
ncbi:MAG: HAMP domain-containing histidine kinase [Planctomycetes bacterium]|nr:HAMP domain-containing histidine kinase [Planctomycetota bacterium]MCB9903789.1 HAMP domain-containing histidine kinase [Planctomycetota bacterium]